MITKVLTGFESLGDQLMDALYTFYHDRGISFCVWQAQKHMHMIVSWRKNNSLIPTKDRVVPKKVLHIL